MDSDGFIPVKYSKRKKGRKYTDVEFVRVGGESATGIDTVVEVPINYCKDVALRKISTALGEIQESEYFKCFMKTLEQEVEIDLDKSSEDIGRIVCYGLGSLCKTTKSIEQFAFLVNVQKKLRVPMEFYDPIFTTIDKSIIADEFQYEVIQENEEGRRKAEELTIFYLPHCPHILSNNLVYANWNPLNLQNCIIVSNGFSKVLSNSRHPHKLPYNYMFRAKPLTKELVLVNSFIPMDVFNDISLHIFPPAQFHAVAIEIWAEDEDTGNLQDRNRVSAEDDEIIHT